MRIAEPRAFVGTVGLLLLALACCAGAAEGERSHDSASPGSLFRPDAPLGDIARDLRAAVTGDLLTVVVLDRSIASSRGGVSSQRSSSASAGIQGLYGTPPAAARLGNLARLGGSSQLDGQGETSRQSTFATTLAVRVVQVLAGGTLVVEGSKVVRVNAERQTVLLRGLVRPVDVTLANTVLSDQIADLEVQVTGKGPVGDAVRRPNFLYRLLLGLLPF